MTFTEGPPEFILHQRSEEITMIGSSFIITDKNNRVLSMGMIEAEVGSSTYLARFRGNPPHSRVVNVTQMDNWLIFDDERHLASWLDANMEKPQQKPQLAAAGQGPAVPKMPADLREALEEQAAAGDEIAQKTLAENPESPTDVTPEDLPPGVFDNTSKLSPAEQLADHEAEQSRAAG